MSCSLAAQCSHSLIMPDTVRHVCRTELELIFRRLSKPPKALVVTTCA